MSAYSVAIKRLADREWSDSFDLPNILSVLRGPDSDDWKTKEARTAPLRLYLLGAEAYKEAGYYPSPSRVSRELPEVHPNDHFSGHIYQAVNRIGANDLPAFDSKEAN